MGFVNESTVRVGEGEVVRLCGQLVNVAPALLQRDIVLEGHTTPGTAEGIFKLCQLLKNVVMCVMICVYLCMCRRV